MFVWQRKGGGIAEKNIENRGWVAGGNVTTHKKHTRKHDLQRRGRFFAHMPVGAIRIRNSSFWASLAQKPSKIRTRIATRRSTCASAFGHTLMMRALSFGVGVWNVIRWLVPSHGYLEEFRDSQGRTRVERGVQRARVQRCGWKR